MWSGWGIVDVNVAVGLGVNGKVMLDGDIRPIADEASIEMLPSVEPYADISVYVDILLGVAKAGANVRTAIEVGLPLEATIVNPDSQSTVGYGDPCLGITMDMYAWARVNLWFWKSKWRTGPYSLLDRGGCSLTRTVPQNRSYDPELDLSSAPFLATSPDGRHLQVQVHNQAHPDDFRPAVAAFWLDPNTGDLGPIEFISNIGASVQDPVAAILGNTGHAVVVWVENSLTEVDDAPELFDILNHQEMMYSYYDGTSWSVPAAILDDSATPMADGSPDISADETGVSIAWVRDTDGDSATNDDKRIMVLQGAESGGTFSWDAAGPTQLGAYGGDTHPATRSLTICWRRCRKRARSRPKICKRHRMFTLLIPN